MLKDAKGIYSTCCLFRAGKTCLQKHSKHFASKAGWYTSLLLHSPILGQSTIMNLAGTSTSSTSSICIYLIYLGVGTPPSPAGNIGNWRSTVPRLSKCFPKVFQGTLCWVSTPRCSGPAPVLPLRVGARCQPRHVDAVPAAAPWAKHVTCAT